MCAYQVWTLAATGGKRRPHSSDESSSGKEEQTSGAHIIGLDAFADQLPAALPHAGAVLCGQRSQHVCDCVSDPHLASAELRVRKLLDARIIGVVIDVRHEHLRSEQCAEMLFPGFRCFELLNMVAELSPGILELACTSVDTSSRNVYSTAL